MKPSRVLGAQQGSIAVESGLGLSILMLLMVTASSYALEMMRLHDDQRTISGQLKAGARQIAGPEDSADMVSTQEAQDYRYGFSHRSTAAAIWLKEE
ncbi:MAG: hypothetical protein EBT36_07295 [Betaproteobacteria bacterium]|jgi:hypothetical protein|nr:hypothetical protein [Betaproteobacteria bacterium]NBQ78657.1 hypothetical protein [Betaproteobacteria bacterium]NBQ95368.1 hypothetical protein [Betaproteobacteria bacterium]NBT71195.1 hypothetical protein [Betaproteobacteria bacterium]NBT81733.1 hypothetical protein [Betaproteobacteria bacterium]